MVWRANFFRIDRPGGMGLVPAIDRGLQAIALGQKCLVLRHQLDGQRGKAGPEFLRLDTASGERLVGDEIMQCARYCKAMNRNSIHHDALLL